MIRLDGGGEVDEIDAQMPGFADGPQLGDGIADQSFRAAGFADVALEGGRGGLDHALQHRGLRPFPSRTMPQRLELLVAFPPEGEVVEIDAVKVGLAFPPTLGDESRRIGLGMPVRVAAGMAARVGLQAGDEAIRRKRLAGVAGPVSGRWTRLDKRHGAILQCRVP